MKLACKFILTSQFVNKVMLPEMTFQNSSLQTHICQCPRKKEVSKKVEFLLEFRRQKMQFFVIAFPKPPSPRLKLPRRTPPAKLKPRDTGTKPPGDSVIRPYNIPTSQTDLDGSAPPRRQNSSL